MKTQTEIEQHLIHLKPILKDRFNVNKIGYFGSYAIDEQNENSDLDLLVEFSKSPGWDFFSLEEFLENSLGMKIDLVTQNALKKELRESILKNVKYV